MNETKYPKVKLVKPEPKIEGNVLEVNIDDLKSTGVEEQKCFDDVYLETRNVGCLKGKAIYLNSTYEWDIVEDDTGIPCLICRTKSHSEERIS
jgi:hypothetical protein